MVLHRNEAVIGQLFRPINLPCGRGYYGNPTPEISWTRTTSNGITQHDIDKTTGALRLPTVDSSNEGPYQCTVSNALGTATTRVNLLLLGKFIPAAVVMVSVILTLSQILPVNL